MPKFHELKVKEIRKETLDCVSITFHLPEELEEKYQFTQGQYLTLRALLGDEEDDLILMRRSEYQEPAADNTYKGLVLAISRTVEKLSRDIAAAIKKTLAN